MNVIAQRVRWYLRTEIKLMSFRGTMTIEHGSWHGREHRQRAIENWRGLMRTRTEVFGSIIPWRGRAGLSDRVWESAAVDTLLERALWHWVPELLLSVRRYLRKVTGQCLGPYSLCPLLPYSPSSVTYSTNLLTSLTLSRKFSSTPKSQD